MKPVVWQPRSSVIDLAYVVNTEAGSARCVVPDGRCGVALVDGVPWRFGPHTRPWRPPRPGVHVVGVRLSLIAGRLAARSGGGRTPGLSWPRCGRQRPRPGCPRRPHAWATTSSGWTCWSRRRSPEWTPPGPPDEIAAALAELVLTDTPVCEVARQVGLSTRQVHRRCLDEFGLAPSLLRRIARVHRAARYTASARRPPLARLATDAGFADQAHFCREILTLSGETPRAAFG